MCSLTMVLFLVFFAKTIFATQWILNATAVNQIVPPGYSPLVPPQKSQFDPVDVNITLTIKSIRDVNIKEMKIGIDFRLTFEWIDKRLNNVEPMYKYLLIESQELWQYFWFPRIDFGNQLMCNSKPDGLFKSPDSRMLYQPAIKHLILQFDRNCYFTCKYDLFKYPLDTQTCPVELLDKKHNKRNVRLVAGHTQPPERMARVIMQAEWEFLTANSSECKRLVPPVNCIQFNVIVKRLIGHHVMTTFIPSFLVVTVSWISFTLSIEQMAPRVTLGLTTLLTLGMQFQSCQKGLPPVAYVKIIDVWCIGCILAVFLSLLEFAISHHLYRKWKTGNANLGQIIHLRRVGEAEPVVRAVDINMSFNADRISGFVIPILFVTFVIVFWSTFG